MSTIGGLFCICLFICLPSASKADRDNVLHFEVEKELDKSGENNLETDGLLVGNSSCTDKKHFCSTNYTCCPGHSPLHFACCPYVQGVCCQDGKHCCPPRSKCDVVKRHCYRETENGRQIISNFASINVASLNHVKSKNASPQKVVAPKTGNIICPDGSSECPDGNTCCQMLSGIWGCCQFPHAVCCADSDGCCPYGYTCDVSSGTCNNKVYNFEWFLQKPATKGIHGSNNGVNSVICPVGHKCPITNPCCKNVKGQYNACCPQDNGVCCSDYKNCYTQGYTCNVEKRQYDKGFHAIPFIEYYYY